MSIPNITVPEKFNMASRLIDEPIQKGFGDYSAIFYEDQSWTYNDVYNASNKTGNMLVNLGVLREERVILLLPDCPEYIFCLIGTMKTGAVPIPVNTMLKPKDYLYFLNDSRAVVLIVGNEFLPIIEEVLDEAHYLREVIVVGENKNLKYHNYHQKMSEASVELEAVDTTKDDAAFWLYSSGTTGSPKGTIHLHHDMVYSAEYFDSAITNLAPSDRIFSASKLFFSYGNVNSLYLPFLSGASVILNSKRPEPSIILETITKYKPTIFFGVPTAYSSILRVLEEDKEFYDLSTVRIFFSAGENLPINIWQKWKDRLGAEICDGIGSTEVGYIYIANRPGEVKLGSSGKLIPGYETKIVDEYDQELSSGQVGNLIVKSEGIAAGYWNKHDKTGDAFIGKWYKTGDQFSVDEEGYYWYSGRSDDMIKVGGIWVSPIEVENALLEHPSVEECAVVGHLNQKNLVKAAAFVVLKEGTQGNDELATQLVDYLKTKIAPYKVPRWIYYLNELPKTATGKTQRFKLKEIVVK